MHVRPIKPSEIEAARALLVAANWGKRVQDPKIFADLLHHSQVTLVAIDEDRVVGFLRAITDGIFNGYISMVVVAESHRNRGIGTALVKHALGDNTEMTWVLRAGRDGVSSFYKKLGFSVSEVAMERTRQRGA